MKKKLTPNQIQFKKEIRRLSKSFTYYKNKGYIIDKSVLPKRPKRITKKYLNWLHDLKPKQLAKNFQKNQNILSENIIAENFINEFLKSIDFLNFALYINNDIQSAISKYGIITVYRTLIKTQSIWDIMANPYIPSDEKYAYWRHDFYNNIPFASKNYGDLELEKYEV